MFLPGCDAILDSSIFGVTRAMYVSYIYVSYIYAKNTDEIYTDAELAREKF